MREKISTRISEELEFILKKFFDEQEVEMFIQNIMDDILILASINSFDRGGDGTSFASGSFFTSRMRSIADRVITFSKEKLDNNKYYHFLTEFGKLMISEGEFFLGSEIFTNILNYATDKDDLILIKAHAKINLAIISIRQAVWENGLNLLKEAKQIYESLNNNKGLSQCEHLFGVINSRQGKLDEAKTHFLKGLSCLVQENDPLLIGNIELNLGNIEAKKGNFDEALKYYQNCLTKFQEAGDNRRVAEVLNNIGLVYIQNREYGSALYELTECTKIASEGRYLPILGIAYVNRAFSYIEINELKLASFYAAKAMDVCYQVNNLIAIADIYKLKGIIAKKQSEFQLAEEFLKASLRLNSELKNDLNFAEAAVEIGLLYKELHVDKSYDFYFNKALEYYQSIDAKDKIAEIRGYMG